MFFSCVFNSEIQGNFYFKKKGNFVCLITMVNYHKHSEELVADFHG